MKTEQPRPATSNVIPFRSSPQLRKRGPHTHPEELEEICKKMHFLCGRHGSWYVQYRDAIEGLIDLITECAQSGNITAFPSHGFQEYLEGIRAARREGRWRP